MRIKRLAALLACALFIFLFFVSDVGYAPGETPTEAEAVLMNEYEMGILEAINAYRANAGAQALLPANVLLEDARVRAYEITSTWSHTRPDGSAWWTVDPAHMYGECLFYNKNASLVTPKEVVDAWIASPSHKAVILSRQYKTAAISAFIHNGTLYCAFESGL